ncbi:hypothetical protein [Planctomycetes bacterium K23_9]|uniref:DUF7932 domain-containing protein n=1 Tax=Stieleria marina TaxID=1930275 RepID=A0A517NRS5_9BACT|nr:hypothetical protein K239x_17460 [Planctomycetes bacterium K23_9]
MTRSFHDPESARTRHTSDAGSFATEGELDCIAKIEVFGRDGANGRDGRSYYQPPRGPGVNGHRGGDATPATRGQNAGAVDIQLAYSGGDRDSGRLILNGIVDTADDPPRDVSTPVAIGDSGYVYILGIGGKGGNGGRGGNGQPGSKGYRGRNATRFSSGGNGGPGGHGGNAGNPTDGVDGGTGADVTLTVGQWDQGLLMLVKGNLAGGDIGFAGEQGRGGKGGKGGDGGSSYHWTETRTYRDSKGNTRTRTVFRSNPGGHRGRSGSDGAGSIYRAKDGSPGCPGLLQIEVTDLDGRVGRYDSPYDLELNSFDIVGEYSVLEPDSIVSVDNLTIRNCGGMPTPPNYDLRFFLNSDQWILHDDQSLQLRQSIAPGGRHTFDTQGLKFRIGDHVVDRPRRRPFQLRHWIDPHATMESGINRPFRQFENGELARIRFPVELTAVTCLNSLAPGESTRVIWAITNVGEETFDHKYLHRAIQTKLRLLGGDLQLDLLRFFDHQDQAFDLLDDELKVPLRNLKPGETRVLETRIGVKDDPAVVAYQGFAMGVTLDQQRPASSEASEQFRCVDYRKAFVRVAERYLREEGSRFLLVANHRTDVNDINKWTQMADYFGSSLDVWDVSYYGFFDLVRAVEKDKSLLEQWRGMTIIVPNNYYETPAGQTVAFRQLAKGQFLRAAADYDINFYVVGDSRTGGESMLQSALIPVSDDESPSQLKTQKDFLKQIKRWNKYIARAGEVVGNKTKDANSFADTELGSVHEFDIDKRTILFQPKKEWLEARAKKLQRKLQAEDPLHRWVVVHRYDTGDTDTNWGFFKRRKIGKLEARRTLDSTKGSAVLYEVDAIDVAQEDFITSQQNKHGMFLALKFEDKVDRLIRLVSERKFPRFSENYIDRPLTDEEIADVGDELVDSILVDIYNEQHVARTSKTWGRGGARALMPKLNYLAERSLNYGVTHSQMQENAASMVLLYDLIANIQWMALESMSVWDMAIFPTAFFKRSRAVSKHMLNRTDRIVTSIFGREPSWWDKISGPGDDYDPFGNARKRSPEGIERTEADREIQQRQEVLQKDYPRMKGYKNIQDLPGLTYDPELMPMESRVIEGRKYDAMVRQEELADQKRLETEHAVASQRSDLLVPLEQATSISTRTRTVSVTATAGNSSIATPLNAPTQSTQPINTPTPTP